MSRDPVLVCENCAAIEMRSRTFRPDGPLPVRYTADGQGISPPLAWSRVPAATRSLLLVMEDADSPSRLPLVQAIATLDPRKQALPEGALSDGEYDDIRLGMNSFFGTGYLAPDPPPGHGAHRYVFQLFALDQPLEVGRRPGRAHVRAAMQGHVLGMGVLTTFYGRGGS